jgi:hypothetical protein
MSELCAADASTRLKAATKSTLEVPGLPKHRLVDPLASSGAIRIGSLKCGPVTI